jgi:hypothetical protein
LRNLYGVGAVASAGVIALSPECRRRVLEDVGGHPRSLRVTTSFTLHGECRDGHAPGIPPHLRRAPRTLAAMLSLVGSEQLRSL